MAYIPQYVSAADRARAKALAATGKYPPQVQVSPVYVAEAARRKAPPSVTPTKASLHQQAVEARIAAAQAGKPFPKGTSDAVVLSMAFIGERKGMVSVAPRYAELHPEAVVKIGDYYYRPSIPTSEFQELKEKGLSTSDIYQKSITPAGQFELAKSLGQLPKDAIFVEPEVAKRTATGKFETSYITPAQLRQMYPDITEQDIKDWGKYKIYDYDA